MQKLLIIMMLLSISIASDITNKITVIKVYDGDTFFVHIEGVPSVFGSNIGVRVYGIDTPELRTRNKKEKALGYKAKELATLLLMSTNKVELRNIQRDKYFRILAEVFVNGNSYSAIMISNKLAYPYFGATKDKWEE